MMATVYEGTEDIAGASVENDQAYRSVAAGDHHEDHHVIHFFRRRFTLAVEFTEW